MTFVSHQLGSPQVSRLRPSNNHCCTLLTPRLFVKWTPHQFWFHRLLLWCKVQGFDLDVSQSPQVELHDACPRTNMWHKSFDWYMSVDNLANSTKDRVDLVNILPSGKALDDEGATLILSNSDLSHRLRNINKFSIWPYHHLVTEWKMRTRCVDSTLWDKS